MYKLICVMLAFGGMLAVSLVSGQTLDYSARSNADDNFLEASFRFTSFPSDVSSNTVLVFVPGTDGDGRDVANNPRLLDISKACHANLLGCYYRGEGLSYDDPSRGSGRALDEALAYFATKTNRPQLNQARLLLVGFSQGGMFVYNYVCWRPERVRAFAALRAIFPRFKPQKASFQVPGLLAAGEYDEPGRIRSIADAFYQASSKNAKWALLWEKESGHDMGRSVELAGLMFEAVTQDSVRNSPLLFDTMGKEITDPSCSPHSLCWFPNQDVANLWKSIHHPESLNNLGSLPDAPHLQDSISIRENPERFECENGQKVFGSAFLTALDPRVTVKQITVSGNCFALVGSPKGILPIQLKICFAPKNKPWGETRAKIDVTGYLDGKGANAVEATLCGMVRGPLTPIPATVYFGFVAPGQVAQKSILLRANHSQVHFSTIRVPNDVTFALLPSNTNGDLLLQIHWTGGTRLGRMQGLIEMAVDVPEKGTLRIPIFGFVERANSRSVESALREKVCSNSLSPRLPLLNGRRIRLLE